jgi:hypothetical protein
MEWDGEWSEVGGWSGVREQRDRVRQYMLSILATNRNGWCYCKSLRDDMCREYSGTCLLRSPLGRNFLAVIDRWLL